MKKGSLKVVGTGITLGQLSLEAKALIEKSEKVLYCVADAATEAFILKVNPTAESLYVFYDNDKPRGQTYSQMVERILQCVREGMNTCVIFYGHPGIFVNPSHASIKIARSEGFDAVMLPAISSLDCLFSDLGIDPVHGCQIFEATDLLLRNRPIDVFSPVVIWQIAATGDMGFRFKGYDCRNVPILAEYLLKYYKPDFEVIVYEAAQYSVCPPVIQKIAVQNLPDADITGVSTLFIPAMYNAPLHLEAFERLGLQEVFEGRRLVPFNGQVFQPNMQESLQ
ncbi:MAG TPA: SAM-dependent methyltransferase [Segetibacter sp.]|jgi:uncharacterized protein YabN with tetrapyrrole methylase and pyrophosphatase domain